MHPQPDLGAALGSVCCEVVTTWLSEQVAGAPLLSGSSVIARLGAVRLWPPRQGNGPPPLVVLSELPRAVTRDVPDNLDHVFTRDERIPGRHDEAPQPGVVAMPDDLWETYSAGRLVDWGRPRARGDGTVHTHARGREMWRPGLRAAADHGRHEEGARQQGGPAFSTTSSIAAAITSFHTAIVADYGRGSVQKWSESRGMALVRCGEMPNPTPRWDDRWLLV